MPEYLKKSDDTGYNYALKDVKYFIQEIRLMEEKMNLSLSEDFFESSSAADYTKKSLLIQKIVAEIKDSISDLKERIKKMSVTEKKFWWEIRNYWKNSWL